MDEPGVGDAERSRDRQPSLSKLSLQITVDADDPTVLKGLDAWLTLGLISEADVRSFAQNRLSCPCPEPAIAAASFPSSPGDPDDRPEDRDDPAAADWLPLPEAMARRGRSRRSPVPIPQGRPQAQHTAGGLDLATPRVTRWLQALSSELSVAWLLFLGVFLVAVSSLVLAASQWTRFNAVGQYGILLTYTLAFWGVGIYCDRNPQLRLTAQTLQGVALVLIPLNVWAMDALGLGQSVAGWGLAIGAVMALAVAAGYSRRSHRHPGTIAWALAPSVWHWGWWPVTASYGGAVIAALGILLGGRRWSDRDRLLALMTVGTLLARAGLDPRIAGSELSGAVFLCGWLVVISSRLDPSRSIQERGPRPRSLLAATGWLIVILAWGMAAAGDRPWLRALIDLAIGITLVQTLGLSRHRPRRGMALVGVGAIALLLIDGTGAIAAALPPGWVNPAIATLQTWFNVPQAADFGPWAYLPALGLLVGLGDRLAQWQRRTLGQGTLVIALIQGLILGAWAAPVPAVRVGVLGVGAIAFGSVALRPVTAPRRALWGTVAHAWILATVWNAITLTTLRSGAAWGGVSVGLAVLEWGGLIALGRPQRPDPHGPMPRSDPADAAQLDRSPPGSLRTIAQQNTWFAGLGFSVLAAILLWPASNQTGWAIALPPATLWGVVPIALLVVGRWGPLRYRAGASDLSWVALVLWPAPNLMHPQGRLWSLGIGAITAAVGTRYVPAWRRQPGAILAVGWAVFTVLIASKTGWNGAGGLDWGPWTVGVSAIAAGLWVGWGMLRSPRSPQAPALAQRHPTGDGRPGRVHGQSLARGRSPGAAALPLRHAYAQALDLWAALVVWGAILGRIWFDGAQLLGQSSPPNPTPATAWIAVGLLLVAGLGRLARAKRDRQPPPWGLLAGVTALGELLILRGMLDFRWEPDTARLGLAIAALGWGWLVWGVGRWIRQPGWAGTAVALGWMGVALGWRWALVTPWAGAITVGAGALGLAIAQRQHRAWGWGGVLLMSAGWFELTVDALGAASRADTLAALAGTAIVIATLYRLAVILNARRATLIALPVTDWHWIAHAHWGIAATLYLGVIFAAAPAPLKALTLHTATGAAIILYAILQARTLPPAPPLSADHPPSSTAIAPAPAGDRVTPELLWILLATLLAVIWVVLLRDRTAAWQTVDGWWSAITAGISVLLACAPWRSWGWPRTPWAIVASGLPIPIALLNLDGATLGSLGLTAIAYGILAGRERQIRLTYLGGVIAVLTLIRWADHQALTTALPYVLPTALWLLAIAQVDPAWRRAPTGTPPYGIRHGIRMVGTGILAIAALLDSHTLATPVAILLPLGLSLGAIAIGLTLRIRAFLFVGTLTLMISSADQFLLLNTRYPFLKWAVGFIAGVTTIWIGATFETRRSQAIATLQRWSSAIEQWE